jgi:hypothetical protein
VVIGPDGPISLSGKFPEFEAAYMDQDFCAALGEPVRRIRRWNPGPSRALAEGLQ